MSFLLTWTLSSVTASLMSLWSQSLTEWNVMIISNDQVTAVWTCIVKKIMIEFVYKFYSWLSIDVIYFWSQALSRNVLNDSLLLQNRAKLDILHHIDKSSHPFPPANQKLGHSGYSEYPFQFFLGDSNTVLVNMRPVISQMMFGCTVGSPSSWVWV